MLMALPDGRGAEQVRDALAVKVQQLPDRLCASRSPGTKAREMARHGRVHRSPRRAVYFCDPHEPSQRGSNENTNGLVRQYLPKGTDLSGHSQHELDAIADELNGRPRQTVNWLTPSERFSQFVAASD